MHSAPARRGRLCLLLAGLVLAGGPARAQGTLATRRPAARPVASSAVIDTAASLRHLFARRRKANLVTASIAAGTVGIGSYVAATQSGYREFGGLGITFIIAGAPVLIKGLAGLAAHSPEEEERVVQSWRQHRLPARWLRRALRPQDVQYAPTAAPR